MSHQRGYQPMRFNCPFPQHSPRQAPAWGNNFLNRAQHGSPPVNMQNMHYRYQHQTRMQNSTPRTAYYQRPNAPQIQNMSCDFMPKRGPHPQARPSLDGGSEKRSFPFLSNERKFCGKSQHQQQNQNYKNNVHKNNQQNNKKQAKPKIDKRDLAENNTFFCDSCDRGFKTEEKYTEHVDSHEKCRVKDCTYIAAPKLVQLHYRMQHTTGLAKKVWSLESAEDVKKWREERKKNYPTAANIAKKKTEEAEKQARGELIETKYFGKMKSKNNFKGNAQEWGNKGMSSLSEANEGNGKNKFNRNRQRKRKHQNMKKHEIESSFPKQLKSEVVSDATSVDTPGTGQNQAPNTSEAIESGNIDSNNNCDDQKEMHIISADDQKKENKVKNNVSPDKSEQKLESDNPEAKEVRADDGTITSEKPNVSQQEKQWVIPKKADLFRPIRPSLLEKLLAAEIRHERNIILQCVHYVAKKKFFQKALEKEAVITKNKCELTNSLPAEKTSLPESEPNCDLTNSCSIEKTSSLESESKCNLENPLPNEKISLPESELTRDLTNSRSIEKTSSPESESKCNLENSFPDEKTSLSESEPHYDSTNFLLEKANLLDNENCKNNTEKVWEHSMTTGESSS